MRRSPYLWCVPPRYPNKHIGLYDDQLSPYRFIFKQGEPIFGDQSAPIVHFEQSSLSDLRRFECLSNNALFPIVSCSLSSALRMEADNDFQLLPIKVVAKDGSTDEFKLVNFTHLTSCIDYKHSEIIPMATDPNGILTFRRLVLSPDCMGEHAFSRERDRRGLILVSAAARDNLVKLKMPGLHFATPDEFFPPPKSRMR